MRLRAIASVLLFFFLVLSSAGQKKTHSRPEHPDNDGPIPDARSFMELFGKLELRFDQAVHERNAESLDSMLAPEFSMRSSINPETPLSRPSWIEKALAGGEDRVCTHEAMTIRAFADVAIVSFVCRQKGALRNKDLSSDYLVVDVWEANHTTWQVGARYLAPVARK
jgi:uncharacterized protein DUF4440